MTTIYFRHWFWDEHGNSAGSKAYEANVVRKDAERKSAVMIAEEQAKQFGRQAKQQRLSRNLSRNALSILSDVSVAEITDFEENGVIELVQMLKIEVASKKNQSI